MKKILVIFLVPLMALAGVRRQVTLELVSDLATYTPYAGERVTTLGIVTVGDAFMEWIWDSTSTNTPSAFVKTNAVKSGRFLAITLAVPSATYGTNWAGSTEVPTKGDVYAKIEALSLAAGITNAADLYVSLAPTNYSVASPDAEAHFIGLDVALGGLSGGGGDVYTSSNNVFTGDNTMTNLTITGTMTVSVINTPTLNATNIVGDGSSITNLNGDNIASGTVADARIASTIARDSEVAAAVSGLLNEAAASALYQATNANLTTLATLDGGALTNLDGANIQSSTINSNSLDAATLSLLVGSGDVSGPASSTDTAVARFSGTGGKTLQDSGVTIDASDNVTIPGDLTVGGTAEFDGLAVSTMTVTGAVFNIGTINADLITGNGASITNISDTNVVVGFTPTNSTPADTTLRANLMAVDAALATAGGSSLPDGLLMDILANYGGGWTNYSQHEITQIANSEFLNGETWAENWTHATSGGGTKGRRDVQDDDPYAFGTIFERVGNSSSSAYSFFNSNDQDLVFDNKSLFVCFMRWRLPLVSDILGATWLTNSFYTFGGLDNRTGNTYGADQVAWQLNETNTLALMVSSNANRTFTYVPSWTVESNVWQMTTLICDFTTLNVYLKIGTNIAQVKTNYVATNSVNIPLNQYIGPAFGINHRPQSVVPTETRDWDLDYYKAWVLRKE